MANGPGRGEDNQGKSGWSDPSKNVLELVEAAIKRQDDLREQESQHSREIGAMRAQHTKEMRAAETDRIDAIRAVDVGNVQRAAEVQAAQALTLATQVTTSAEALRASQAAQVVASDTKLVTALEPIQKRIEDLSRAQYEAQGVKAQGTESRGGTMVAIAVASVLLGLFSVTTSIVISVVTLLLR